MVLHEMTNLLKWEQDKQILERCFSAAEIEQYKHSPSLKFLSGRFAVKEALLKCLGKGMEDGISLTQIETISGSMGQPELILSGEIKRIADSKGIVDFHVSISHSGGFSIAMVIAEGLES